MKRLLTIMMLLCAFVNAITAQRITHNFNNASMSDALKYIQQQTSKHKIIFIYNELEDFKVTTSVKGKSVPDAIKQVIGFYPIRMTQSKDNEIYVECTHKTDRHLTGRIVDENGLPLEFADVRLLNPSDSSYITGGITNASGVFVIPLDKPRVIAKFSYIGYKPVYKLCSHENVGTIKLQIETTQLGEVTVKGERPQYRIVAGGMTVDIQNSPLKDVGTADDVLSMLPQVQGENGNFKVFAKGVPEIYINNKKVQDASELKQLKSTNIKSVDIITSPGARYNAEVGAVIRIKTIKRQGDGISATVYGWTRYNKTWTTYDDATVRYRKGGLEISGNLMFDNHNNLQNNMLTTDIWANGNHVNIVQAWPAKLWTTMLGGKMGVNYDFNENHSAGLSYSLNGTLYAGGTVQSQQTIIRNNSIEGIIVQIGKYKRNYKPNHEGNLYYVGKVGNLGIDFNGSWIWKKLVLDQESLESSEQLDYRSVTTHNENRNRMLAGKLVLTYPLWKGEMSVGTELTRSVSHSIYDNVEHIVASSDDEIKESNNAVFAEYQMSLGQWNIGAGLRYESVNSDYYSFGQHQSEPSRKYHDLFPSLSVSWRKNKCSLSLSYSKGTSRPTYYSLRSNLQYNNRYEYEGGNPLLRPTIKQNLEFNFTYSWLTFTAGYTHSKDISLFLGSLYQEGTEITVYTNRNFDKFGSYYASLTVSPKLSFYNPVLTLNYFQQDFDTQKYGIDKKLGKPQFEVNLRNWFTIDKTTKAMLSLYYSTDNDYGFVRFSHDYYIGARLQKTFLEGDLTLSIFADDIFHTSRERWTSYYPVTSTAKDNDIYRRCIGAAVTYNFNAIRSKYKGTGAGNDEKNRL